jgi:2-polyprenyl-3-methyl-5-hydroxy-6-metoxy-1,4-benzoquinol methylase
VTLEKININNYSKEYAKQHGKAVSMEAILSEVRCKTTLKSINRFPHKSVLEIGCGFNPICRQVTNFDHWVIVDPSKQFIDNAKTYTKNNKVQFVTKFFEESFEDIKDLNFDFIICSSLLHEVPNPDKLLDSIYSSCSKNTILHIDVPNVYSFHRLLAVEMGLIPSIYEKSKTETEFQRTSHYDKQLFINTLEKHNFQILEFGTYLIKPFSNEQMEKLMLSEIISPKFVEGLEKTIKYLPDMGAEMFVNARIK